MIFFVVLLFIGVELVAFAIYLVVGPAGARLPMHFRNPANGYEETLNVPFLWALLFGFLYFAAKGVWTHAVVSFLLAFITCGFSWLIYPFFARKVVRANYLRKGWVLVE